MKGRKFALSDLHGRLDLYEQITEILQPNDTVFFLGDAGDRGPDGWTLIKKILKEPRFFYLKGNHEDMLIAAMAETLGEKVPACMKYKYPLSLVVYNGGINTFDAWGKESDKDKEIWFYSLAGLPTYYEVDNINKDKIILTHAGFTPPIIPSGEDLIWGREHFWDKWPKNHENVFIIHGHTPCPYLNENWNPEMGAIHYADGHKIDIDVGSYATNYALLLDLDTFEEHIFTTNK